MGESEFGIGSKPENMCTDHISPLSLSPPLHPRRYQPPSAHRHDRFIVLPSSPAPGRAVYPVVSRQLTPQTRAARESCVLCVHCGEFARQPRERESWKKEDEKDKQHDRAIIPLLPSSSIGGYPRKKKGERRKSRRVRKSRDRPLLGWIG